MDKIIVTIIVLGAVTWWAYSIFNPDSDLFKASDDVIDGVKNQIKTFIVPTGSTSSLESGRHIAMLPNNTVITF